MIDRSVKGQKAHKFTDSLLGAQPRTVLEFVSAGEGVRLSIGELQLRYVRLRNEHGGPEIEADAFEDVGVGGGLLRQQLFEQSVGRRQREGGGRRGEGREGVGGGREEERGREKNEKDTGEKEGGRGGKGEREWEALWIGSTNTFFGHLNMLATVYLSSDMQNRLLFSVFYWVNSAPTRICRSVPNYTTFEFLFSQHTILADILQIFIDFIPYSNVYVSMYCPL